MADSYSNAYADAPAGALRYAMTPSSRCAAVAAWRWIDDHIEVRATTAASHTSSAALLQRATGAFVARRYAAHAANVADKGVDDLVRGVFDDFRHYANSVDSELKILATPAWMGIDAGSDDVETFRGVYQKYTASKQHYDRVLDKVGGESANINKVVALLRMRASTTDYGWARLALTNADVDVDAVPAWEKNIHHKDMADHYVDLEHLCVLIGCALKGDWTETKMPSEQIAAVATACADLWLPLIKGEDVQANLRALQVSPNPFSGGFEAHAYGVAIYDALVAKAKHGHRVLTATNDTAADDAPVLSYEFPTNLTHWGAGVGATLIAEAVAIAAASLAPLADELPADGSQAEVTYTRDCDATIRHLARTFVGWHHSRVADNGETAHAIAVGQHWLVVKAYEKANECVVAGDPTHACMARLGPYLVQPLVVYVRGPSAFCRATKCKVENTLQKTSQFDVVFDELAVHLHNYVDTLSRKRRSALAPTESVTFSGLCAASGHKTVKAMELIAQRSKVLMEVGSRYRQTTQIMSLDMAIDAAVAALANDRARV